MSITTKSDQTKITSQEGAEREKKHRVAKRDVKENSYLIHTIDQSNPKQQYLTTSDISVRFEHIPL